MASTQRQMQAARETDVDSGAVGDLLAAGCRAELWRVVDARGPRAVRALGEATPRAPARVSRSRPSAAARGIPRRHGGHCAREKSGLRTGHHAMLSSGVWSRRQRRRACRMGSRVSPQVPSGSFRRSTGLTAGKICSNRVQKGDKCAGFRRIGLVRRWARLGECQAATGCRPSCRRLILPRRGRLRPPPHRLPAGRRRGRWSIRREGPRGSLQAGDAPGRARR